MYLTGADLAPDALVGPGLVIPYPAGVSMFATVGENLTLHAQTMLVPEVDASGPRSRTQAPLIGNGLFLEPHAAICGPIKIGDDVTVEVGCVVRFDVTSNHIIRPRLLKIRVAPVAAARPKR
jgi:serine acetyltransferase